MKIKYTQSLVEYRKAVGYLNQRLLKKSKWRFVSNISGFVLGLSAVIGLLWLKEFYTQYKYADLSVLWFSLCTLLFGCFFWVAGVKLVSSKLCENIFSTGGIYTSEIEAQVNSENFLMEQSGNTHQYDWKNFIAIEKTDEQIYLLLEPGLAVYIPRVSFESDNSYKELFDEISKVYNEAQ